MNATHNLILSGQENLKSGDR
ncbi:hypothetical protein MPL3356_340087 [Mesorhizobium plurifarium]|uniref:Uncharacterized protein n=1 Tax=Mesorhizobium plurifarium TaxID=69974 RepID=A0A090E296_MESPL|nr:hypothetical protein MPL3356_340087 [Mesorhizobium plurifarium]